MTPPIKLPIRCFGHGQRTTCRRLQADTVLMTSSFSTFFPNIRHVDRRGFRCYRLCGDPPRHPPLLLHRLHVLRLRLLLPPSEAMASSPFFVFPLKGAAVCLRLRTTSVLRRSHGDVWIQPTTPSGNCSLILNVLPHSYCM